MRFRGSRVTASYTPHPVDFVFAGFVLVAFAYALHVTRDTYFWSDDWLVIRQGGSATGLWRPYNNSLSFMSVLNDRVLVNVFGFDYIPFRVVGLLGLLAVPSAYFLTTRRQFGAVFAALLALPLLFYGRYISLTPSELNHNLALVGAIVCAAALVRGKRADWMLAVALTVALCSAGGGLAVAAACLVHNACTRPHLRRWFAVLVPSLLWFVWWLIYVRHPGDLGLLAMSTAQTLQFIRDLAYSSFESVALGNGVVAVGLVLGFVGYGIWTVSKGLKYGANFLAWSVGVVVWSIGLSNSRGLLANPTVFRYRYTALGLTLLAIVPPRPIVWPTRFPVETRRRWVVGLTVVVLLAGVARAAVVRSDVQAYGVQYGLFGASTRGESLVLALGPSVIADKTTLPFGFGALSAGQVRELFAKYGQPFRVTSATADQKLVQIGIARARATFTPRRPCARIDEPFTLSSSGPAGTSIWARDAPVEVDIRRFGETWVRLGEAQPHQALRLSLPSLGADEPWQVRADGACRVGARTR